MIDERPTALKEIFDRNRHRFLAEETRAIRTDFDADRFLEIAGDGLDTLGVMQRMRQVAAAFDATLPADHEEAFSVLMALAPRIRHGFASIALCEVVLLRNAVGFDRCMDALRFLTRFGSAEFAIRPFLEREPDRVLATMRGWTGDEDEHVRRLASEGSRPRLPWSSHWNAVIADPSVTWPILDALRSDPSAYVRKSVANHLNDIGKDHPDWLIARLTDWPRNDERTVWIIRHALRSLIKNGDSRALALVGASDGADIRVDDFAVSPARLSLGERLTISARLTSTSAVPQRLVVDYAIHYVKKSGSRSRKVFKLRTLDLAPRATETLSIGQTVRDFTTRTHHPGFHKVELMANGQVVAEGGFDLAP